jgi:Delta3-Delta2-enoyl-CoA isomerase
MKHLQTQISDGLATITLRRGKVNALNEEFVIELSNQLHELTYSASVRAVVIVGSGAFFSFGFDIPEFRGYTKPNFMRFLYKFTALYTEIFTYPKPVVAALNGHTIAGACMLALACDERVMASGKAKISLNEITFGAAVFAGSVEMLRNCVGLKAAEVIVLGGGMYLAAEARELGLVDRVEPLEEVLQRAQARAMELAEKDAAAYAAIKALLRDPIAEVMRQRERASIERFANLWYSEPTQTQIEKIVIR